MGASLCAVRVVMSLPHHQAHTRLTMRQLGALPSLQLGSATEEVVGGRGPSVIDPLQSPLYGESLWLQEMPVTNNGAPSYIHAGLQDLHRRLDRGVGRDLGPELPRAALDPAHRRPAALLQGAVLLVLRRDDAGRAGALRRALAGLHLLRAAGRLRRGHSAIIPPQFLVA